MVKESPRLIPMSPSEVIMDVSEPSKFILTKYCFDSWDYELTDFEDMWTPGRRETQNRAAQRAFRERKEKRARDLEEQLTSVTDKYKELESDYSQLQQSYDKLQQTLELLTCDDEGRTSGDQLRRFLDIIQGKARNKGKIESKPGT
ncbi:hypothetical protein BT63DRAFT_162394 [Microthyrium microscopicum]|uniref:Putative transcription factor kapC n=1 Tax=Microthyrium microscopicum TaxID=703497 RepID=A0A6A6UQI0_9PEZI|nr:hypothetical protein BT63DRAFT_162394 [Microthyrium microscopicum]